MDYHLFQFVLPEYGAHAFLALLFFLSGQWTAFAFNLPLIAFNANKCVDVLFGLELATDI